jgi:anti-sigma regulatory factor (Ser/Thr protein kinase)
VRTPGSEVSLDLPDDATAPRLARALVRDTLHEWGLHALVDDAETAVSELVTNALRHGLPPVAVSLHHQVGTFRIDVSDGRPSTAYRALVVVCQDGDESGRGRGIVESVSHATGVDGTAPDRKSAFASWDVPDPSGSPGP